MLLRFTDLYKTKTNMALKIRKKEENCNEYILDMKLKNSIKDPIIPFVIMCFIISETRQAE